MVAGNDDLMKRSFDADPQVQLTPIATDFRASDVANYFDTPAPNTRRRWVVRQGPAGTRAVTMRVMIASGNATVTNDRLAVYDFTVGGWREFRR